MKQVSKVLCCCLIIYAGIAQESYGQVGGEHGFGFLQVPTTARVAALGGVNITSQDKDVNMFLANPALLSPELHKHASINYMAYLAGIKYSSLTYAHHWEKAGTWGFGLQYMDYGSFEGFDDGGNATADFQARDYALTVSHSHTAGAFTFGGNLKFAQSFLDSYTASALLVDIGGVYKHPEKELVVGLLVKHIGAVIQDYLENSATRVPFDIQIGTTFKPEHMPLRFTFTAYNLAKDNIAYYDPFWDNNQDAPGFVDKVFRHMAIGTEVLLSKHVNLRAGYNHLVRKEMRMDQTAGGAGFSFGLMVRVKAFEFAYTKRLYHVAGGSNSFTLASDLSKIIKNK